MQHFTRGIHVTTKRTSSYNLGMSAEIDSREVIEGDDFCNSLYYGHTSHNDTTGIGFPRVDDCANVSAADKLRMKTVHKDSTRLSKQLYADVVDKLVITCCDVILRRKSDGKLLLFYRRDKPAAGR